jgi:hypothetical protein
LITIIIVQTGRQPRSDDIWNILTTN